MSEIKWTDAQKAAIDYHKSSVIVSAAAGSGKTAVLVERIINMLDTTDIDRLLVVTFTQAAASQMRENIANALEEKIRMQDNTKAKEFYHRQLLLLPGANISTIHSFCSKIIKDNFDKLGLSADYSLAEPDKSALLLAQSIEELIETEYETGRPEFLSFVQNYTSYKNDSLISEMLLSLYRFSRSVPYPDIWLDNVVKKYESITESNWLDNIYQKAKSTLELVKNSYIHISDNLKKLSGFEAEVANKYLLPLIADDLEKINLCYDNCTDFDSTFDAFNNLSFKNFPTIKDENAKTLAVVETFRKQRETLKSKINDIKENALNFSLDELNEFSSLQLPHIKEITSLTKKLDEVYTSKKRSLNILDFNDLEHLAITLLTDKNGNPTACAKALSDEFDEIIVDEYQDTNDVQEAILNAVSCNKSNIFMVGDMKQSIYRFRNTAPELFLSKTESYSDKDSDTGRRIFLSSNFRSRKNILDFSNLVFSQIMSKEFGEIEYGENEKLYYGADYEGKDSNIDITVLEKNEYTDFSAIEQESAIIADKINSMISSGFLVTDKKTKQLRPVTYKDFAILLRTSKNVSDEMTTFLTKCGIPVYNDGGKEALLSSVEVQTVISLLKIIDNPYNDIALISVLRSLFYKFSDDLLLLISKSDKKELSFYEKLLNYDDENVKEFLRDLEHYRKKSSILSVYELIDYVIQKNMLMEFSACLPGGNQRILNLRYLLRLADNYTKSASGRLFGFLIYIDDFSAHSQSMISPKVLPESSDVVTITTMHKSKGLEYPVVIIPRLGTALKNHDLTSKLLIHKNIGIGFDYIDTSKHIKIKSPVRTAISRKTNDEYLSEELRVLYVALTRAKEKLILIGSCESHQKLLETISPATYEASSKFPAHVASSARSYLVWIMLAVCRHKAFEITLDKFNMAKNTLTDLSDIGIDFKKNIEFAVTESKNTENDFSGCEITEDVRKKLEYIVPQTGQGVFSKYSVSELKKYLEDETDYKDYFEKLVTVSNVDTPVALSSSARGSAIHKVFELIDFKNINSVYDIEIFINTLKEKEIISQTEATSVPCEKIFAFFSGELGKKLKSAKMVKREVPFNIHIGDDFSLTPTNEQCVQLQGVIDCYFKDDEGYTIIDFKSDFLNEQNKDAKIKSYKKQLEFYILALKTMYKNPPIKACIYFLDDNSIYWL